MHLKPHLTYFFKASLCLLALTHLKRVPVFGYQLPVNFFHLKRNSLVGIYLLDYK